MEKIINTETDSDVKLREEANNKLLLDSLNNFKIEFSKFPADTVTDTSLALAAANR